MLRQPNATAKPSSRFCTGPKRPWLKQRLSDRRSEPYAETRPEQRAQGSVRVRWKFDSALRFTAATYAAGGLVLALVVLHPPENLDRPSGSPIPLEGSRLSLRNLFGDRRAAIGVPPFTEQLQPKAARHVFSLP
jgi:hypothetical protein